MGTRYHLNALDTFACLGDRCEDNCCSASWDIHVDATARAHWRTLPEGPLKSSLIESTVEIERDGQPTATFKRTANGSCVHLGQSGLCTVHSQLGAEALPTVCRDYPRLLHSAPGFAIRSATLSCPEIARQVLFGNAEMFRREDIADYEDPIKQALAALTRTVFSYSQVPLNAKLVYLAQTLVWLASLSARNALDSETVLVPGHAVKKSLFELNLRLKHGKIRPDPVTHVLFWRGIAAFGRARNVFTDLRWETCDLLAALERPRVDSKAYIDETNAALWECRKVSSPIMAGLSAVLHRYAEASLTNKGFPWNPVADNYIASFMYTIIPLALIELLLRLQARDRGCVSDTFLVNIVYKMERRLGHSHFIYSYLDKHPDLLRLETYIDVLATV